MRKLAGAQPPRRERRTALPPRPARRDNERMLRRLILLASLLALLGGASGLRMELGLAAWAACAAVLLGAQDATTASIGAWAAAVVALLVLG